MLLNDTKNSKCQIFIMWQVFPDCITYMHATCGFGLSKLHMVIIGLWCESLQDLCIPRKFKGGICRVGHLAVTYGRELLYLRNFSQLSLPSNFVKHG